MTTHTMATTERSMHAQFASECLSCGHEIAKGEPIVFDTETRFARHTGCERRESLRCLYCHRPIEDARERVKTSDGDPDAQFGGRLAGYMHYNCREKLDAWVTAGAD